MAIRTWRPAPIAGSLGFLQEAGFQHQPFDLVRVALDLLLTVREANVLDRRAPFKRDRRALDLQVLDDLNGIAVAEPGAVAVLHEDVVTHFVSFACPSRIPGSRAACGDDDR